MAYNTALFDLDGTLVKTERAYYNILIQEIFSQPERIEELNNKMVEFWASKDKETYSLNNFNMPLEQLLAQFRLHENLELRKKLTKEFHDADYLSMLKYLGFKTGIVTGAPRRIAQFELELLPIEFDTVVFANASHGVRTKPDPQGLFIALRNLGSSFMQSFYVGNATEDMAAAKAAGILGIFIERGYNSTEVEPTHRIKTLYDLQKIIHNA